MIRTNEKNKYEIKPQKKRFIAACYFVVLWKFYERLWNW